METGERLLSRERTSTDDSVAHEALTIRPNSGAAVAGPPGPAADIEAAPAAEIREAGAAAVYEPAGVRAQQDLVWQYVWLLKPVATGLRSLILHSELV